MTVRMLAATAALALLAAAPAEASSPSVETCFEGSDFIANAAIARENGVAREVFVARVEADFVMIRAFPPELRWFVMDEDDERFLRTAVAEVFDSPRSPEAHRAGFLDACFSRASA